MAWRRRGLGNSYDRRARRKWLIAKFASPSGKIIKCHHCQKRMRTSTHVHPLGVFEVDRFPVCGHAGGTYTRDNIVPSCALCNRRRCTVICRAQMAPRPRGDKRFTSFPVDEPRVSA